MNSTPIVSGLIQINRLNVARKAWDSFMKRSFNFNDEINYDVTNLRR